METRFTNGLDPDPRNRQVFAFHKPETLAEWLATPGTVAEARLREQRMVAERGPGYGTPTTLLYGLRSIPPLDPGGLWPVQARAIQHLEASLAEGRPRPLVQMATSSGKTYMACHLVYRLVRHAGARRATATPMTSRRPCGRSSLGGTTSPRRSPTRPPGRSPSNYSKDLRTSYFPRIAATVDMIATGTDIRPLGVVLSMRNVRSRNFFEQMKGRGVCVIPPTEFQSVTPDSTHKTRFVIVDAVGVTEKDLSDSYTLEKQPAVPFDKLLDAVARGNREPEVLSSLASRLARLDRQLTPADHRVLEAVAQGTPLRDITAPGMGGRPRRCQGYGRSWPSLSSRGRASTSRPGLSSRPEWTSCVRRRA